MIYRTSPWKYAVYVHVSIAYCLHASPAIIYMYICNSRVLHPAVAKNGCFFPPLATNFSSLMLTKATWYVWSAWHSLYLGTPFVHRFSTHVYTLHNNNLMHQLFQPILPSRVSTRCVWCCGSWRASRGTPGATAARDQWPHASPKTPNSCVLVRNNILSLRRPCLCTGLPLLITINNKFYSANTSDAQKQTYLNTHKYVYIVMVSCATALIPTHWIQACPTARFSSGTCKTWAPKRDTPNWSVWVCVYIASRATRVALLIKKSGARWCLPIFGLGLHCVHF